MVVGFVSRPKLVVIDIDVDSVLGIDEIGLEIVQILNAGRKYQ